MSVSDKKIYLVLIFLLLPGLLIGCVEKETPDENDTELVMERNLKSYFPVIKDMVYQYAGEGNEYASFIRKIKYTDDSRVQFFDNNGGTIAVNVYEVTSDRITRIYREGEFYNEVNILNEVGEDPTDDEIILKTPLKPAESWEIKNGTREIVSIDETVTVPAGVFYDVIKVRVSSKNTEDVTYEYYAPNTGLILRETAGKDYRVTSSLSTFGNITGTDMNAQINDNENMENNKAKEEKIKIGKNESGVNLSNPQLELLAYQLEHQLRATFRAAFESYINHNRITGEGNKYFEQILSVYRVLMENIAVDELVESNLERLRDYIRGGEGEVAFPVYEVVHNAKVLSQGKDRVTVGIHVTKNFPEREWSGKAYSQTINYEVELIKENGFWKLKSINGI